MRQLELRDRKPTTTTAGDDGGTNGGRTRPCPARTWRSTRRASPTTEIKVGGVASVDNPLGGKYGDSFDGVKAYFDMINASGGIYGRELVLAAERDDKAFNNSTEVQALLTEDIFAVLPIATLLFTGAQTLVDEGIPTFGWTINPEWEGSAEDPKANLFGQTGSFLCFDCASPGLPWLIGAGQGARRSACSPTPCPSRPTAPTGSRNSFDEYGDRVDAEVGFVDKSLQLRREGPLGPGVEDEGRRGRLRDHLHGHQRRRHAGQGDEEAAPRRGAEPAERLRPRVPRGVRRPVRGLLRPHRLRDLRAARGGPAPGPARPSWRRWTRPTSTPSENALVGLAQRRPLRRRGLKDAGPDFDQQKVIDAINKITDFNADGIIYPVDWTKAHTETNDEDHNCQFFSEIEDSEFVPEFTKPGKPFVCPVVKPDELGTRYTAERLEERPPR